MKDQRPPDTDAHPLSSSTSAADIARAWAEEVERRISQVERGEVKLIDGEKVFAELRRKYQK